MWRCSCSGIAGSKTIAGCTKFSSISMITLLAPTELCVTQNMPALISPLHSSSGTKVPRPEMIVIRRVRCAAFRLHLEKRVLSFILEGRSPLLDACRKIVHT